MFRKGLLLLLCLLSFNSFSSNNGDLLKIGILYFNPPFAEVVGSNTPIAFGFNVEIIKNICGIINKQCELVPMRFDKLLQALDNNRIDAMIVGISLMPERPENYLFSYPYFISEAVFFTLRSNQLTDLNNQTIGIVKNTLFPLSDRYDLVFKTRKEKKYLNHKDELRFKFYNNLPELLMALNTHQVNAVVLDAGAASYWINLSSRQYVQIGPVVARKSGLRIMTTKNHAQLISRINNALLEMEKDRTLLDIYRQYWGALTPNTHVQGYLIRQSPHKYQFIIPGAFND
ncbi:transporter substrate-binding domain-containing protein [Legionella spiritensis]|uniref:transporter substrate-binding domain-containing protein n=1 Tax=Legionella spiritensis TaxID=452 RepID=UPI000F6F3529|nr:transporter substrate-binding domain-containing protein [Legionella spiritensis]VEG90862.1 glutamine ABC transporter [Legionella spiritensis]